jgi:hypothetical protein
MNGAALPQPAAEINRGMWRAMPAIADMATFKAIKET